MVIIRRRKAAVCMRKTGDPTTRSSPSLYTGRAIAGEMVSSFERIEREPSPMSSWCVVERAEAADMEAKRTSFFVPAGRTRNL